MVRRADRLFEIIQVLRAAPAPVTAASLAEQLEVTVRTVYRDIASLTAQRVPIDGAAGLGYVLRRGFDLPPLMFTAEEIDAIAVGARLVRRLRDPDLQEAAERVLAKVTAVVPTPLQNQLQSAPYFVSDSSAPAAPGIDLSELRAAIRHRRKMQISYTAESGQRTNRTIWPIAMVYYTDVTLIGAWCELRADYRHFRIDRVQSSWVLDDRYPAESGRLMQEWLSLRQVRPAARADRAAS
ncbi:MAG: YafY family transcriptional regulator [Acetobacteraceae bacterium]|nr:YafY family transcriptional regulator [Acetobacteraceae bacterium]